MDNLKLPAYPITIMPGDNYSGHADHDGLTKLEKASLMIAQGLVSKYTMSSPSDQAIVAKLAVEMATEVLTAANL